MRQHLKQLAEMFKQVRVTAPIVVLVITLFTFSEIFWFRNSYMLFYLTILGWIFWQLYQYRVRSTTKIHRELYNLIRKLRDAHQLRILYLTEVQPNRWYIKMFHKITNRYTLSLYATANRTDLADLASDIMDSEVFFVVPAKTFFTLKLKGMIGTESETVANKALKYIGVKVRLPT